MRIMLFHASAGEGHRRAAYAIETALVRAGVSKDDVTVADALDFGSVFFKKSYTGFYFWCVKHLPKLWGAFYALLDHLGAYCFFYPLRRLYNAWHGRKLLREVIVQNPDLIICTHFFSAEVLGHAKKHSKIKSKLVVVVTDFHPVRVWMHDGIDAYWVLSDEAKQTLIRRGVASNNITAGGFPIMPDFQKSTGKENVLKKHGMEAGRLTLLLTTGSFGLGEQERLLGQLETFKNQVQCLVVCGRNQALQESLEKKKYGYPIRIFGFVNIMPELMEAADVMVAKPGGSTTAEAMAKGLPMIATGAIPGQETENLKFLLAQNASFAADTPEEIVAVIGDILENPGQMDQKRQAMDRICNPRAADDLAQMRLKWIP